MYIGARHNVLYLKSVQDRLIGKYQVHRLEIEALWRSFGTDLRKKTIKGSNAAPGIWGDRMEEDIALHNEFAPEFHLRSITEEGSDFLLDILKHRATKSLLEQYEQGVDGFNGDHAFIISIARFLEALAHRRIHESGFMIFLDLDWYGLTYVPTTQAKSEKIRSGLARIIQAGLCVSKLMGDLIIQRQTIVMFILINFIDEILKTGSTTKTTKPKAKKPEDAARTALSELIITLTPEMISPQGLLAIALDQKSSLEEYLSLCQTKVEFFDYAVKGWFLTRPELIKDEKGRTMPVHTVKSRIDAGFEMTLNAATGIAIWDSISRLLQLLIDASNEFAYNAIIFEELAGLCHFDYGRVHNIFKRNVQTGLGSQYFKRISGVYDNGIARIKMKGMPEDLAIEDPQLQYMLRLCHNETTVSNAISWIKKLDELHQLHPEKRGNMREREWDSFTDLAATVDLVQSLSSSLPLPATSSQMRQTFVTDLKTTAAKLHDWKSQVDLSNLKKSAKGVLNTLENSNVAIYWTKMGTLYRDAVEESLKATKSYCQQQNISIAEHSKSAHDAPPTSDSAFTRQAVNSAEFQGQQQRQKEKNAPLISTMYDKSPLNTNVATRENVELPVLEVKLATIEMLQALFKGLAARNPGTWTDFIAALGDLKFSVLPKLGSVFIFFPDARMGLQKPLTLHKPHKFQLEHHVLLRFARRLERVYGWDEKTFHFGDNSQD